MKDNIKKVFEILGVEPDEEFKIEDKNCFWKITERLNLFYRQGHYDNGDYAYNGFDNSLIIDLIKNPELIIKLPKELKKKKLRDLTEEELRKWTEKNCKYSSSNLNYCDKCIFGRIACFNTSRCWLDYKDLYSDKFLDQEIDVEEEDE